MVAAHPLLPDRRGQIDHLLAKIKTLNERIWEQRASKPIVDAWLANFRDDLDEPWSERLHALYLLSRFTYFGNSESRVLLRALYRDIFRYPIIESIRRSMGDTIDSGPIAKRFETELLATRFLGLGNPSESGTHLLYYFRQENDLPYRLFVHTHQLFNDRLDSSRTEFADPSIKRLVFLDDFCATGDQAMLYSRNVLSVIASVSARTGQHVEVLYYPLVATKLGLSRVRRGSTFTHTNALIQLDGTFRCFAPGSRYFSGIGPDLDQKFARAMCLKYGRPLFRGHPFGYRNSQLLLGFQHNIPDNTLPIFWAGAASRLPWEPVFRRHNKLYY